MTRRRSPAEVSASRIDQAAARPRSDLPGMRMADDAILANPQPQGTHEQRMKDEKAEAQRRLDASRWVARMTMLRAHGCTGKGCQKAAHAADRAGRDDLLAMLGLKEAS